MAALETFRAETHQWLDANAPASIRGVGNTLLDGNWGGRKVKYPNPDMKVWLDMMAARGWTAPEWPTQYGGGGLSKEEAKVLQQEMNALRLPAPLIGFGLTMIGPDPLAVWYRRTKTRTSAWDHQRRDSLVPGLFRTGLGQRPGVTQNPGNP